MNHENRPLTVTKELDIIAIYFTIEALDTLNSRFSDYDTKLQTTLKFFKILFTPELQMDGNYGFAECDITKNI